MNTETKYQQNEQLCSDCRVRGAGVKVEHGVRVWINGNGDKKNKKLT